LQLMSKGFFDGNSMLTMGANNGAGR